MSKQGGAGGRIVVLFCVYLSVSAVHVPAQTIPPVTTSGTDTNDMKYIRLVSEQFNLETVGDPCVPKMWDWLTCTTDASPRILSINLANSNLSGSFPSSLTNLANLTTLLLNGNQLYGPFIDLTGMTSLIHLSLEDNQLTGPIPDSTGNLPNLKELDLSNNNLTGDVPQSLASKFFNNALKLRIDGNNHLCLQMPSGGGQNSTEKASSAQQSQSEPGTSPAKSVSCINVILAIVGSLLATLGIVASILLYCCCCRKKRSTAGSLHSNDSDSGPNEVNGAILPYANYPTGVWPSPIRNFKGPISEMKLVDNVESCDSGTNCKSTICKARPEIASRTGSVDMPIEILTLRAADVKRATRNFTNKIGEGGYGPVYYGKLPGSHQEIAVKVQSSTSRQGALEFLTEVAMLSRAKHPNLVSLIGHSNQETEVNMLVYEYLAGGTLQAQLYGSLSDKPLDWGSRLKIAVDAAKGIEYLHNDCFPCIIHRDVKSKNILLTKTLDAKVADFGLSKFLETQAAYVSTVVKGTSGYLDPEYFESKKLTKKSDVYSFGIVLLEIISGREAFNINLPRPQWRLSDWTRTILQQGQIEKVVDKALEGNFNILAMWKVAELAMTCVEPCSIHRPTMSDVVIALQSAVEVEAKRNSMIVRSDLDDSIDNEDVPGTPARQYSRTFNSPLRYQAEMR